jgi:putative ABC transport system permease protein
MLLPLRDTIVGNYRHGLLLVVGAALLVLLVTCANVAGLQLARASTREREIAVRLALGASRWAIVRHHLAESFLLVAAGGIGGVLLGQWAIDLLLATFSRGWLPRSEAIAIDTPVLIATAAVALLTGLIFGLYPALRAVKIDATNALRAGTKGSAGPQSVRVRSALVVAQIALTLVLLACAGLVLKSFATLLRVNPGMQIENTLTLNLSPSPVRFDTDQKRADYYRRLLERVSRTPGIEAAAFTQTMPFDWGIPVAFTVQGRTDEAQKLPAAFFDSVSASFFATTRIPLLSGRLFNAGDNDHAPPVLIISQTTAKLFFPNENPLGRHLLLAGDGQQAPVPHEIIGVVGDVPRNGLGAAPPCQVYA